MRQKVNTVRVETNTQGGIEHIYINDTEVLATDIEMHLGKDMLVEVTVKLFTYPGDCTITKEGM